MTRPACFATVAVVLALMLVFTGRAAPVAALEQTFITIGTGGVTGVYYPTGGAICWLVNQGRKTHGIRCSVESTGGSVSNIESMRAGELEIAVSQSDVQYAAYNGSGSFANDGAFEELRSVFSVHAEPFTIVARADAGIKELADLKGKRVNIGNPGSGQRGTLELVLEALNWNVQDFAVVSELPASEHSQALCDDKIDAFVYTVGHPSASIKEATTGCNVVFVPVVGPAIDKLVAEHPYYAMTVIPGGLYRGNPDDTPTFGLIATVVATDRASAETIYVLTRSVFENFEQFRQRHPVFLTLEKAEMAEQGLTAPLHAGAARYFREAGLR